ncbi:TMEM63A, partial [Symbiodinium sp. CCMP2456]
ELLREMPMTSPCTVSLLWSGDGGSDQPDLSFRIWLNGRELNCSNRKVDLGTNALQVQEDAAENISLNQVGMYDVKVESFSRNIADVPFKVVVRRSGQEAEIY